MTIPGRSPENRVRLLIVASLYSALVKSIIDKEWRPQGMPAFAKLVERLADRNVSSDVVLVARRQISGIEKSGTVMMMNLDATFHVLAPSGLLTVFSKWKLFEGFIDFLYDVRCAVYCALLSFRNKYDVYYCDRANVVVAAFFALVGKKVILRLHGVISLYSQLSRKRARFMRPITYLSFFAPFAYIICSKDGSPGEVLLKRFRGRGVRYETLLNGVDSTNLPGSGDIRERYSIPAGVPVILFVGRLEASKGCDLFVKSMIRLAGMRNNFYGLVVGDGELSGDLSRLVAESRLRDRIILTGSVGHTDIDGYYRAADIYVSLNHHGNLSNTVLEAYSYGNCIVTFDVCKKTLRDISTREVLSDCAIFINRENAVKDLTDVLNMLITHPEKIKEIKTRTMASLQKNLQSWQQRIDYEIDLLERIGLNL